MAATALQKQRLEELLLAAIEDPDTGDYRAMDAVIGGMRRAGTPCERLQVNLHADDDAAQPFAERYEAVRETEYPGLPPIGWISRAAGVQASRRFERAWPAYTTKPAK